MTASGLRCPGTGYRLTLQVAWAADNTNTALPAFLETAHQRAGQKLAAVVVAVHGDQAAGVGDPMPARGTAESAEHL